MKIRFEFLAAIVVMLALAGSPTAFGSLPDNDNFAAAQAIGALPFSDSGDLAGAGTEPGEPQFCNFQQQSVWYSFTPGTTTALRFGIAGSDFGVVANIYRSFGSGIGSLGFTGCLGSGGTTTVTVPAGATYYFQVGSVGIGSVQANVNFDPIPPPANDDFANAVPIAALPFSDVRDRTAAALEPGEPELTGCGPISHTIWYAYTAARSDVLLASGNAAGANSFIAVYTGSGLGGLSEVACGSERNVLSVVAGRTYYIQVGSYDGQDGASQSFTLDVAPAPSVAAFASPPDPSVFDTVQFSSSVFDIANGTVASQRWTFGDGATADGCCPSHRYAADGSYTATVTVTMADGRVARSSVIVLVKTRDVAITKLTVPQSASAGQTRQLVVTVTNKRAPETVQVQLAKSGPAGWATVGTLTLTVGLKSTVDFKFSYVFTPEDAAIGKVSFQATAAISGGRDALPADNVVTALPTKVK